MKPRLKIQRILLTPLSFSPPPRSAPPSVLDFAEAIPARPALTAGLLWRRGVLLGLACRRQEDDQDAARAPASLPAWGCLGFTDRRRPDRRPLTTAKRASNVSQPHDLTREFRHEKSQRRFSRSQGVNAPTERVKLTAKMRRIGVFKTARRAVSGRRVYRAARKIKGFPQNARRPNFRKGVIRSRPIPFSRVNDAHGIDQR